MRKSFEKTMKPVVKARLASFLFDYKILKINYFKNNSVFFQKNWRKRIVNSRKISIFADLFGGEKAAKKTEIVLSHHAGITQLVE